MKFVSSVLVFVLLAVVVDRCFSDDVVAAGGLQNQGSLTQDNNQQLPDQQIAEQQLSDEQFPSDQDIIEAENTEDWGEEDLKPCQFDEDCLQDEVCYKSSCFSRLSGN